MANAKKPANKTAKSTARENGFDRGHTADQILGATNASGELMFLVKYKNVEKAELVPSRIVNEAVPQMVIQFYEARLTWTQSHSDDE